METTRMRFGSVLEWLLAAALIVAALAVGAIVFREFRTVRAVMPVIAGEARIHDAPAGIPARAVSVPMLLLGNGLEVRLGDHASDVATRLGAAVQVMSESLDRTAVRERITRFYDALGTRFIVVFEAANGSPDQRVAAIYLP